MLLVNVDRRAFAVIVCGGKLQNTPYGFVQFVLVKIVALPSFGNKVGTVLRHFQVKTCFDTFNSVVSCAPVGDGRSVIPPLSAQDVGKQTFVFRAVHAVKFVVRTHHGMRTSFGNHAPKGFEINFSQRTLVNHAVRHKSAVLGIVGCKVFKTCSDAGTLHAVYVPYAHDACNKRVFAEILEVSSAQRTTFDVDARSKQQVLAFRASILGNCLGCVKRRIGIETTRQTRR